MNKVSFLRYVENSRDCEQDRLDAAVAGGLCRAKKDRFDFKKPLMLAAACVVIFTFCISIRILPLKKNVEDYYRNRNEKMPGSAEVLDSYIKEIAGNFKKHIGGE